MMFAAILFIATLYSDMDILKNLKQHKRMEIMLVFYLHNLNYSKFTNSGMQNINFLPCL